MKKRILALVLCLGMVATLLVGCAKKDETAKGDDANTGDKPTIYVLTAAEDHGWTGSVATFAKTKAEELNQGGKYNVVVKSSPTAADQMKELEDIASNPSGVAGVVVQPQDDSVEAAIQQIVDAKIPYTAFDRIIAGVKDSAVANVTGDNKGIGAAAASYFVSQGLQPGEAVYVFVGDTSSVCVDRNAGFEEYLTGKLAYNGEYIAEDAKWTEDQLSSITQSAAMGWSRSNTTTAFETLLSDSANADIKWFYTMDDELALGIVEALEGSGIDDATKEAFLANKPYITAAGGSEGVYAIIRGEASQDLYAQLGGLICVTYSPDMIQTTMQDLVDYLDGKEVTKDHVIACELVDASNVSEHVGFAN